MEDIILIFLNFSSILKVHFCTRNIVKKNKISISEQMHRVKDIPKYDENHIGIN